MKAHEEGKSVAIYSTDLSASYDTVKILILISKLEHYGFREQSKNILDSYLYDREQYVETKTSEVKESLEVSKQKNQRVYTRCLESQEGKLQ